MKSEIEQFLIEKIKKDGVIPFSSFMNITLFHENYGYYNTSNIFGDKGDFITSPITSSLFGESMANEFINLSSNKNNLNILEMGGGDGSLAVSMMKYLSKLNCLPNTYIILESSAKLKEQQIKIFKKEVPELFNLFVWIKDLNIDNFEGLVVANEFFDVNPTERFKIKNNNFEKLFINFNDDDFEYVWNESDDILEKNLDIALNKKEIKLPDNYMSEINTVYSDWISKLDKSIKSGVIFVIDYGYNSEEYFASERSDGTLVCIHNHQSNFNPLANIGKQDISSFVNFSHLSNLAIKNNFLVDGYLSQSSFLLNLGILDIYENKEYDVNQKLIELNKLKNILLPNTMGEIFKVLILKKNITKKLVSTKEFNKIEKL
tara:strand:+ start:121179 stop:122303 length:1125 start_codon:yes stop_codon:yes gene_type:complete